MERGLRFGNAGILLLLPLLLKLLTGLGSAQSPGSMTGRDPPSATRGLGHVGGMAGVMERRLDYAGAPVTGADVTVEDDEAGSAGDADEPDRESKRNVGSAR